MSLKSINESFNRQFKQINEESMADKVKSNQNKKEMTRRAIKILRDKGGEYKDLEKEFEDTYGEKCLDEDTVKQNGKWVNKGKEGTHGKFKTKKAADAQRKAMFANGYKAEALKENFPTHGNKIDLEKVIQVLWEKGNEIGGEDWIEVFNPNEVSKLSSGEEYCNRIEATGANDKQIKISLKTNGENIEYQIFNEGRDWKKASSIDELWKVIFDRVGRKTNESLRRKPMRESEREPEIKRYSDVRPYNERKYWYFTTHGVQPGSIPKDLKVLEVRDGQNDKGTWGTYVMLDGVLNTSELKKYDMRELVPPMHESKKRRIHERNLTRSERHNRDMEKIFSTKKAQDKKFADFLRKNGYSEEQVDKLQKQDKLSAEIARKFTPKGKQPSDILGKILGESSNKRKSRRTLKEETNWDAYAEIEKGQLDDYAKRVKNEVTPQVRRAFSKLKRVLDNEDRDAYVDGFYYPQKAIDMLNGGNRYHMNKYMDLNVSDTLDMIDENGSVEEAIDSLFADYRPSSAYSWASNFVDNLRKLSQKRESFIKKHTKKLKENHKRVLKESFDDMEVFMNTWANYNEYGADGVLTPTGWMSIDEAIDYCEEYADYEPFINDTDNVPFDVSEYSNASSVLQDLKELQDSNVDEDVVEAIVEAGGYDVKEAVEIAERGDYYFYPDVHNYSDLAYAVIDSIGSLGDALGDRVTNYIDEDQMRREYSWDVRDMMRDDAEAAVDEEHVGEVDISVAPTSKEFNINEWFDEDDEYTEDDLREQISDDLEFDYDAAPVSFDIEVSSDGKKVTAKNIEWDGYDREQEIEDWIDEHEDDYLDSIIDEEIRLAEAGEVDLSNYFDYEAYGRDLSYDGYTFTDKGAILIL